jgi:hypothetical protein
MKTQANLDEEIRVSLQEAERLSKLAAETLNESPPEADRIAQQALDKAIEALRMKFGKVTEYERLDEVLKKAGVMGERELTKFLHGYDWIRRQLRNIDLVGARVVQDHEQAVRTEVPSFVSIARRLILGQPPGPELEEFIARQEKRERKEVALGREERRRFRVRVVKVESGHYAHRVYWEADGLKGVEELYEKDEFSRAFISHVSSSIENLLMSPRWAAELKPQLEGKEVEVYTERGVKVGRVEIVEVRPANPGVGVVWQKGDQKRLVELSPYELFHEEFGFEPLPAVLSEIRLDFLSRCRPSLPPREDYERVKRELEGKEFDVEVSLFW